MPASLFWGSHHENPKIPGVSLNTQTFTPDDQPGTSPICAHCPSFVNSPNPSMNPWSIDSHQPVESLRCLALAKPGPSLRSLWPSPGAGIPPIPRGTGPGGE